MLKRMLVPLSLLLSLAGCGALDPKVGDDCISGTGACTSSSEALFCEAGTLKAFPCRGTGGCAEKESANQLVCDFTKARPGDACPSSVDNEGQCDAANANQLLFCTKGAWKADVCKGCAVRDGNITCQQ